MEHAGDRGPASARIPRGRLDALRVLSLVDGLLLVVLVWAALGHREQAVAVLGPTHGVLFLLLVASLAWAAGQGWFRWRFVLAVAVLGPLASGPGLERARRRGGRRGQG